MSLNDDELDALIEALSFELASSPSDAGLVGDLGCVLAQRYQLAERPADLVNALRHLHDALAMDPDHPDAPLWRYALGTIYGQRAIASSTDTDWDTAIGWLTRACHGPEHEDLDRSTIVVELGQLHFHRFHALRGTWETAVESEEATRLITRLDALDNGGLDQAQRDYLRMFLGLARIERYRINLDPFDRTCAIEILTAVLPNLSTDTPWLIEAYQDLADAHADMARTERDLASLDHAIDTIAAALNLTSSEDPIRAELHMQVYPYYEARWELRGKPADRDRLIRCLGVVLDADLADSTDVLLAHQTRIGAVHDAVINSVGDAIGPTCAQARDFVADAYDALCSSPDADNDLIADVALAAITLEIVLTGQSPGLLDTERLRRCIELARGRSDAPAEWESMLAIASGVLQLYEDAMQQRMGDFGLAQFTDAVKRLGPDHPMRAILSRLIGMATFFRGTAIGDTAQLSIAHELVSSQPGDDITDPATQEAEVVSAFIEMVRVSQLHDADPASAARRALDLVSGLPATPWITDSLMPFLTALNGMVSRSGSPSRQSFVVDPPPAGLDDDAAGLGATLIHGARIAVASATLAAAMAQGDTHAVRQVLHELGEHAGALDSTSPMRLFAATTLGAGCLQLACGQSWDSSAADAALHWNTEATRLAGGPDHPLWSQIALRLAQVYRLRGRHSDVQRSRSLGLSALRGHAWGVLLQSGTEHAIEVARRAAGDATTVAGWCAQDGAWDDLVRALDAGRGLVLHTATTSRGVSDQLHAIGRDDLNAEWAQHGGSDLVQLGDPLLGASGPVELPGDLRQRVLNALADGSAGQPSGVGRLLDPPSIAEIQAALLAHCVDALVYLVPSSDSCPGMAVIVPTRGEPGMIPLPELDTGPGSIVATYSECYDEWHKLRKGLQMGDQKWLFDRWRTALAELVEWAWRAAGRDVLAVSLSCAANPRLVLVPVGMLAVVPWHAAKRQHGAGPRYLMQDAIISYTPSARLFCEISSRLSGGSGDVLIIANGTGKLEFAKAEAHAIHEAFYRHGRYLWATGSTIDGTWRQAPDGAGTSDQLLEWLTDPTTPRQLLHIAADATAEPRAPLKSRIRLAGDRQLLTQDLLDRAPTKLFDLGIVFLSACTTNVSGLDYDEAFSLSTAFLAVGARTAIGSLWKVRDTETSLLMFMVHHYLATSGCKPADALRQAQLWMLDPHRQAPDTMPDKLVTKSHNLPRLADPVFWAGFNHLGV